VTGRLADWPTGHHRTETVAPAQFTPIAEQMPREKSTGGKDGSPLVDGGIMVESIASARSPRIWPVT
jgi:hypothetical protein